MLLLLLAACPDTADKPATDAVTFVAVASTEIDFLWVVDDSVSMIREQEALASVADDFFDALGGVDLHLGFTTTSDTGSLAWVDSTCGDDAACLDGWRETLRPGNTGDDQERGFEAAFSALEDANAASFLRTGALHVVAVVSDEEDCSGGTGATGEDCYDTSTDPPGPAAELTPVGDLLVELLDLDADGRAQVTGFIGPDDTSACEATVPSARYAEAIDRTGGSSADICARDWTDGLASIAAAAVAPPDRFRLPEAADPTTIEVTVAGSPVGDGAANGWTYDDELRLVVLHGTARPAEGDEVGIAYTPM